MGNLCHIYGHALEMHLARGHVKQERVLHWLHCYTASSVLTLLACTLQLLGGDRRAM